MNLASTRIDTLYGLGSANQDYVVGLKPNQNLSIAAHAQSNLYLVSGKNPFPGLVDLDRTPYRNVSAILRQC
jgi:hypothetical protein